MNINYTLLDILTNNIFVWKNIAKEHIQIENGIEIPYPHRTIVYKKLPDEK